MCVFQSRDKDSGHKIRLAIAENPKIQCCTQTSRFFYRTGVFAN